MGAGRRQVQGGHQTPIIHIDAVANWSQKWKLPISVEKCDTGILSTDAADAEWSIPLHINQKSLPTTKNPHFLSVTFDRRLTFKEHVKHVASKMERRSQVLRVLAGTNWGCKREDLRAVYNGYVRPVADYCGATWGASTAATNLAMVDSNHRTSSLHTDPLPSL
jgi:hypothetical protein